MTTGFDVDGAGGDIAFHTASVANENRTFAMDVAADAGVNFRFLGVEGVDELNVAAFDDVETDTMDFADDGAGSADDHLAAAFDIGGNDALEMQVAAFDFAGADVAHLANVDIAACANRRGGSDIDLDILQTDAGGAVGADAIAGGAADFEFVIAVEAFHFLEMLLTEALLTHLLECALFRRLGGFRSFACMAQRGSRQRSCSPRRDSLSLF